MLYNVSIYSTPRTVAPVPLHVSTDADNRLVVLNAEGQNAVEAQEMSLYHAVVAAGLVGEMVCEPLDADNTVSIHGGLRGIPLWLSETLLTAPQSPSNMKKVWLISQDPCFQRIAICDGDRFPRSKYASKIPAASFARMAQSEFEKSIAARLAYTHPEELVAELKKEDGVASAWKSLGVTFHQFGQYAVKCRFPDDSMLDIGAEGQRVDLSEMDHGDGNVVRPDFEIRH